MSLTTCSRRTARTRLTLTSTMRSATGASCDWCDGLEMSTESYNDWMNDHDGGERFHAERKIDDFFSSGRFCEDAQPAQQVRAAASAPPPPPPPAGSPVATQEPEDWLALHPLANYSSQLGDWQPSGGDHNAWGSLPEPDDEEPVEQQAAQATDEPTNEPSALKPAHVPTPRAMFFHCGSFTTEEPESVPPAEPRPLPSARAAFYHQSSFTAEQRLNAHTASMPPGEAAHHRALAPAEVRGADGRVVTMAFDPEGEVAYYHEPHEAGRPNYAVLGPTGFGDRGTFYSRNSSVGSPPLRARSRLRRSRRTLPRPMRFAQSKRDGFATMAMAASYRAREPIRTGSSIGCAISSLAIDATARIRRQNDTRADNRTCELASPLSSSIHKRRRECERPPLHVCADVCSLHITWLGERLASHSASIPKV